MFAGNECRQTLLSVQHLKGEFTSGVVMYMRSCQWYPKRQDTLHMQTTSIRHTIEHRNNIRAQNVIPRTNTQIRHMEGTHRHTLGSQTQHTHTLWKTIHGLANKTPTQPKTNNHFQREDSHITHTNSKRIKQTIHQHSQTQNTQNKLTHW